VIAHILQTAFTKTIVRMNKNGFNSHFYLPMYTLVKGTSHP